MKGSKIGRMRNVIVSEFVTLDGVMEIRATSKVAQPQIMLLLGEHSNEIC